MINAKKFYINGEWISSTNSETIDVINPANEKVFTSIGSGCANDINNAVDAAKQAFKNYSKTDIDERINLLNLIYKIYKKRYEEIAQTICLEMGCPIQLSRNAQTKVGLNHLKTAINLLNDYKFEYKENNLMDTLFPITRSCVGTAKQTRNFTVECHQCFWCHEKKWAFDLKWEEDKEVA